MYTNIASPDQHGFCALSFLPLPVRLPSICLRLARLQHTGPPARIKRSQQED